MSVSGAANNMIWIIFLGAPGCGKGTQAEYLIKEQNFAVISVGDLLRLNKDRKISDILRKDEKLSDSNKKFFEDGTTVGELMKSGSLFPDEIVIDLVRDEVNKASSKGSTNILFDGFPRTVVQAKALDGLAKEFHANVDKVLNFVVKDDIITERILGRFKCTYCGKIYNDFFLKPEVDGICDVCGHKDFDRRSDDNEESLKKRLSEYNDKTQPLIEFYKKSGVLVDIDAALSSEKVKESVLSAVFEN